MIPNNPLFNSIFTSAGVSYGSNDSISTPKQQQFARALRTFADELDPTTSTEEETEA